MRSWRKAGAAATAAPVTTLRELGSDLAQADTQKLARVVAMIDALPERGAADGLIDRLRPRLERMCLARPLRFPRLLFLPLDPVLVPAAGWRSDMAGVPRTVIAPIAALVRGALGEEAAALDAATQGHTTEDRPLIGRLGAALWPKAAKILLAAEMPPDWRACSFLPEADFVPLARVIAAALESGPALPPVSHSPDDLADTARAILAHPAAGQAGTLATVLLLTMERGAAPGALLQALERHAAPDTRTLLRNAAARAFTSTLDRLAESPPEDADVAQAADHAAWCAASFDSLSGWVQSNPHRRGELEHARRQADASCRERFAIFVADGLALPPTADQDQQDDAVDALEQNARDLRRMEQAGRLLGGGDFYDGKLRGMAERMVRAPADELAPVDRLRLAELMLGPDAALALAG